MHKLLAIAVVTLSACSTPTVRMSADSVVPVAHGSIGGHDSGFGGQASFGELGVEDVERAGSSPRIEFRGEEGTLSLGYMPASYAGVGRLDSDLSFGGEIFHESSEVHTEMGADFLTARLTAKLFEAKQVRVGVGVGLCGLALKMRVEEQEGAGEAEFDELIPLTMAVARVSGEVGEIDFEASYGFRSDSGADGVSDFEDLDARMSFALEGASGALVIGYRAVRLDDMHGVDGEDIDVAFGGPYLGLTLGF